MNLVYFGEKYAIESGGLLGTLYCDLTGQSVTHNDIAGALLHGEEVHIRPATVADTHKMEAQLAIVKAQRLARLTPSYTGLQ